jgi:hypothetical protein
MTLIYATLAEVKDLLGTDVSLGSTYDALLTTLLSRASRLIDDLVKRWPGYFAADTDEARYFDGSGCSEQWVDELAAAPTSIYVAETGQVDNASGSGGVYTDYTAEAWFLWPDNAQRLGIPYRRIDLDILNGNKSSFYRFRRGVKVVGKFGYSVTPPADIKQAALIQAVRWFKRGQQAYQDTGAIVELGRLTYTKALDPEIQTVISHYVGVTI